MFQEKKDILETTNQSFVLGNFFPNNRTVYEIMWKNAVQADGTQTTV